jgi:hypothetical protein
VFIFRWPQMAYRPDEPPAGPPAPAATPPAPTPPPADPPQAVPYERFSEVNTQLKEARELAERLQAEATQRQRQGLSELDQIKAQLADEQAARATLEQERDAARGEVTNLTRGGWVRSAASAAGFHDAEDAIARIDLAEIKTEAAAKREVEALAERAKHLIKPADDGKPSTDLLQQVLDRGRPAGEGDKSDDKAVIPPDQFNALKTDQLVALQESDPELYRRSLAAAAK